MRGEEKLRNLSAGSAQNCDMPWLLAQEILLVAECLAEIANDLSQTEISSDIQMVWASKGFLKYLWWSFQGKYFPSFL